MPKFKVKAKDVRSNLVVDTIEANTQREVIDILHRRGLTVLGLEESKDRKRSIRSAKKVRVGELALFSRQLSTMVNAGLTLIDALRTLEEQTENYGFKNIISDVTKDIEGGSGFAESISKYPKIFGPFFINMVRSGEASGSLAEILVRVADYLESVESVRRKVKMAMIYPGVISVMAFLITMVLFLKVIPVFEGIYADFDAIMPLPTRILIAMSGFLRKWFWLVAIVVVIILVMLNKYKNTSSGRELYDRLKLKLPIFGTLFHKVAISRFSKTLATLVKSGVPILSAFEIVKEICGNRLIEHAVEDAAEKIKEGKNIEEPLRKSGVFPPMVVKMVAVGEKSGQLEQMLEKISSYYDEQVTTMVAGLANLIEPLLIVFLGIIIGGIVLSMFLPIFKLSSLIGA